MTSSLRDFEPLRGAARPRGLGDSIDELPPARRAVRACTRDVLEQIYFVYATYCFHYSPVKLQAYSVTQTVCVLRSSSLHCFPFATARPRLRWCAEDSREPHEGERCVACGQLPAASLPFAGAVAGRAVLRACSVANAIGIAVAVAVAEPRRRGVALALGVA